jgi:hypothetical protein
VYGRLKLTALCPEAREAFYGEKIDASKALLIARIGHHDTQRAALKDLLGLTRYDKEPMSYRQAHQHVLQHYMLALKEAPFDIADPGLLPKAGACGACPKRTGNLPDLFGDVKSADVCTDPKCFDDKRHAHYSVAVKALEAKGNKVISGDAAKKLLPNWQSNNAYSRDQIQGGYMRLTDFTYAAGRSKKVSEVLGADYEPTLLQHPGTGEILKVASQQAITAAAAKSSKQQKPKKAGARKAAGPTAEKIDLDDVFRKRAFLELCAKMPKALGKPELAEIAQDMLMADVDHDLVASALLPSKDGKARGYGGSQKVIQAAIPKLEEDGLARLLIALLISRDDWDRGKSVPCKFASTPPSAGRLTSRRSARRSMRSTRRRTDKPSPAKAKKR